MKKILFLAVALMATLSSFAQSEEGSIVLIPRVGATMSNFNETYIHNEVTCETSSHFGVTAGAEVGYQVNKWFMPTIGMMFVNNGSKFDATFKGEETKNYYEIKNNWLSIPIMANFYVVKGLALKGGIQPTVYLFGNEGGETGKGGSMRWKINDLDFQFPVGLSYEYKNFILDARYHFSFMKLARCTYGAIPTAKGDGPIHFRTKFHNQFLSLTLGYKLNFKGPKLQNGPLKNMK